MPIFRLLYLKQYFPYISFALSTEVALSLDALVFRTLYSCLYEVLAGEAAS